MNCLRFLACCSLVLLCIVSANAARSFAVNSADAVQTTFAGNSTLRTRAVWFRLTETAQSTTNFGRLWSKGAGTLDEQLRWLDNVAQLEFRVNWTTTGVWTIPSPAINAWHHLTVTYDFG